MFSCCTLLVIMTRSMVITAHYALDELFIKVNTFSCSCDAACSSRTNWFMVIPAGSPLTFQPHSINIIYAELSVLHTMLIFSPQWNSITYIIVLYLHAGTTCDSVLFRLCRFGRLEFFSSMSIFCFCDLNDLRLS